MLLTMAFHLSLFTRVCKKYHKVITSATWGNSPILNTVFTDDSFVSSRSTQLSIISRGLSQNGDVYKTRYQSHNALASQLTINGIGRA